MNSEQLNKYEKKDPLLDVYIKYDYVTMDKKVLPLCLTQRQSKITT